jgi:hypothetical protein
MGLLRVNGAGSITNKRQANAFIPRLIILEGLVRRLRFAAGTSLAALALLVGSSQPASAVISTGPGGRGVTAGQSSLFPTLDYSDTFTQTPLGGQPGRPAIAAPQPLVPGYVAEQTYGNASALYAGNSFSFAAGDIVGAGGLVQGNASAQYPGSSGAGSATGITQTGGGVDYGLAYGMRDEYWVQVDASAVADRIDISSGATGGIFGTSSLSVFFRGDGTGKVSLFNGALDTPVPGINTTIAANREWHNYAVRYDRTDKEVEIYVDEVSRGIVNLNTFAGGAYANFSNAIVGAGGSPGAGDRVWTDNIQIGGFGAPTSPKFDHPNPGNIAAVPGLMAFYDFNEASGADPAYTLNKVYDRVGGNDGYFVNNPPTTRTFGLVGQGAAEFHDAAGDGIQIGGQNFNNGLGGFTIEMLFTSSFDGSDQAEFFRQEAGNNRILLSFQSDANTNNDGGQLVGSATGAAGISLGLNTGGYKEMDVALDGLGGRPTLGQIANGDIHHLVASYDVATGMKSMYIDGVLVGQIDGPDGVPLLLDNVQTGFIGSDRGSESFPGIIDEVAFYDRALTGAEVAAHYGNVGQGQNYFASVPEPGTYALAMMGVVALLGGKRFSRRRAAREG